MKSKLHKAKNKVRIGKHGFSKRTAIIFSVFFAGLGTYIIVSSFAATPTCTAGQTFNSGVDLSAKINSAPAGSTICLNAGNYSYTASGIIKTSTTTVTAAPGVDPETVHVAYIRTWQSKNITFQNVTIAGGEIGEDSGQPSTYMNFNNIHWTGCVIIRQPTTDVLNITFDGGVADVTAAGSGNGANASPCLDDGRFYIRGYDQDCTSASNPSGDCKLIIKNMDFPGSHCTDGIEIVGWGYGFTIQDNTFHGILQNSPVSCTTHTDPIQFYGGSNGTVTGNYFYNNTDGIMSSNGNGTSMDITNNVFGKNGDVYPYAIVDCGDSNMNYSHNDFLDDALYLCYSSAGNIGPTTSTVVKNNYMPGGFLWNGEAAWTGTTADYNMAANGNNVNNGTHKISGTASFIGGAYNESYASSTSTSAFSYSDFALASGSPGKNAASDGTDIGIVATNSSPPAANACDATVSTSSALNTALATAGASKSDVICLSAGTYSALSLSGTHANNVTIEPDPGLDATAAGKVTINGSVSIAANSSNITINNLYITGGVTIHPGAHHITFDHNDVTGNGYGFGLLTNVTTDPDIHDVTISNNSIHDTAHNTEGDAIRLQGYYNVTITGNEFYHIYESSACVVGNTDNCHTDIIQSYQAQVNGHAHDLVITKNYMHDNNAEMLLKDGDISPNVTFSNNLGLRDNTSLSGTGQFAGLMVQENTSNFIVRNNTMLDNTSSAFTASGSTANPTLLFDHNVWNSINRAGTAYTTTADYNIYTSNNQFAWTSGSHDKLGTTGVTYMCASSCGNGTKAGDDYRLVTNPNNIGIDWSPADNTYGPIGAGSPPPQSSAPTNTTAPTISGTTRVGSTLTTTNGTWGNSPTSYTYQWQVCNSSGASCTSATGTGNTTASYKLSCSDYRAASSSTVRVVVTATNSSGNATSTSNATTAIQKPATPTKGDFNDDCFINSQDLSQFISGWRKDLATNPSYSGLDITGPTPNTPDGYIDGWDLNMLVTGYGYRG